MSGGSEYENATDAYGDDEGYEADPLRLLEFECDVSVFLIGEDDPLHLQAYECDVSEILIDDDLDLRIFPLVVPLHVDDHQVGSLRAESQCLSLPGVELEVAL